MARFTYFQNFTELWRQSNFAWYMGGQTVALVGMWSQRIAIGWLTWELTASNFWLGAIAFADLFPTIVITPFAGVIADRVNRLNMGRLCQALASVHALVLWALTFTGLIEIWSLLFLTLILGVIMAFSTAARLAMVPNLMEAHHVPVAVGIDSAIYNMARVVGPMIAAATINLIGTGATFLFNAICFGVFVYCLVRVRLLRSESLGRGGNVFAQTFEGIRYAARHPGIGPALILLAATALGVKPFLELLPGLADGVFRAGVEGFASFAAIAGAGAIVSGMWVALRGRTQGTTRFAFGAMLIGTAGIFMVSATEIYWVGLAGTFLAGGAITLAGTSTQILMQNSVEGAARGRVMSLYGMVHRGAPALGAVVIGAAAELIGLQAAMMGGGALTGIVFLVMLRRYGTMASALEVRRS
jgi:MFS family permease